jgi:hypothetical protein
MTVRYYLFLIRWEGFFCQIIMKNSCNIFLCEISSTLTHFGHHADFLEAQAITGLLRNRRGCICAAAAAGTCTP